MTEITELTDDQVYEVWNLCVASYLRCGRRLAFPRSSDPRKTYQWRYAKSLAAKFSEWGFDEQNVRDYIDIAVDYANENRNLHKGLAALHQGNLMQICYDKLKKEESHSDKTIDVLARTKKWLIQIAGNNDLCKHMLKRQNPQALCNLTIWYQAARIPPIYLALSKSCGRALAKVAALDEFERNLMPSAIVLYKLRHEFLNKADNLKKSKSILGSDLKF
jgi:hypothetical protein